MHEQIDGNNLIGFMRGHYQYSSLYRKASFVIQILIAVPAAFSIVYNDDIVAYYASIATIIISVLWWVVNRRYHLRRGVADRARRASIVLNGLGGGISGETQYGLQRSFVISETRAASFESENYYASKQPPGPKKLIEILEECIHFSEPLHKTSASAMLVITLIYPILFSAMFILYLPEASSGELVDLLRLFMATIVVVLTADLIGAYFAHSSAVKSFEDIRYRLASMKDDRHSMNDIIIAMSDYNAAIENAPEVVPFAYYASKDRLNKEWKMFLERRNAENTEGGR